ncbi:hypothetical protein J3Q64DRAFT_1765490 [Phycomyces blakesleeanus]|uniref:Uncharacterized protein n=1 Tax=Phycomyces blakesleeanus TaxID=4837 RepID=A0ABR3APQ0_PHYBL
MASLFFEDYEFPAELYQRDTGDFTIPVRTLLDFTPHILKEIVKKEADQEPIRPRQDSGWTSFDFSRNPIGKHASKISSERVSVIGEFIMECAKMYMETQRSDPTMSNPRQQRRYEEEEAKRKAEAEAKKKAEKEKKDEGKDEKKEPKDVQKTDEQQGNVNGMLLKSAAVVGALSMSVYSTYHASSLLGDVKFHDQLELLLTHVEGIVQSTSVWISEREKLGDFVPEQVKKDLSQLKQLIEYLGRLDPRSEKRTEAAGWGIGAVGSLSVLGGVAYGSAAIMTGGAVVVLGGLLVSVSTMARYSGKRTEGARVVLEGQVRSILETCKKDQPARQRVINNGFTAPELPEMPHVPQTDPRTSTEKKRTDIKSAYAYTS